MSEDDRKRITEWADPGEMMKSGYGDITCQRWCELERDRHAAHGTAVKIVQRESDKWIALFRA